MDDQIKRVPLRMRLAGWVVCSLVRHRFVDVAVLTWEVGADGRRKETRSEPHLRCIRCLEPYLAAAPVDVVDTDGGLR